jgi:hypothetical protein
VTSPGIPSSSSGDKSSVLQTHTVVGHETSEDGPESTAVSAIHLFTPVAIIVLMVAMLSPLWLKSLNESIECEVIRN